ncbi:MAG: type II secretion system protein [Candidatus Limnocylindrales bacterium]
MLAALAVFSLGLAVLGTRWSDVSRREREQDLLRIGALYASAIGAYHAASPGSLKEFPPDLGSLLADGRRVGTLRHLRRLYPDPLDPSRPWGIVRGPDGSVRGIFSRGTGEPLRREPVETSGLVLPAARHYAEWKFAPKVDR